MRTSLVGRRDELDRLAGLLAGPARILTVTGRPGVGKRALLQRVPELVTPAARSGRST